MPPKKTTSKKATVSPKAKITGFFAPKPSPKVTKRTQTDDVTAADMPPAKRLPKDDDALTVEQQDRVAHKKIEAETKLLSKKLGVDDLDCSWVDALYLEFKKPYFTELWSFVEQERRAHTVYPPVKDVFTWMTACPITEVKVVILGQDPYHGPHQAHGLCFSVPIGTAAPPSLVNMYKELASDIEGFKIPDHGYLIGWAKQGVLLLNACLTVRAHQANSHQGKGWEKLTDATIRWINDHLRNVVFLLWGTYAQKKGSAIDKKKHHVLKTVHPSPLSAHRGFFGCKHFSEANRLLRESGKKPIDWAYLPRSLQ